MFAIVHGGGVVRFIRELPFTYNGVQRFRSLSAEKLAAHGVLPVTDLTPPFDPETEKLSLRPPAISVLADRVEVTYQIDPR